MTCTQAQVMKQLAPYPQALADLVGRLTFKPGWTFHLENMDRGQGSVGLTLRIIVTGPNSYESDVKISVHHFMIVPAAAFDERAWMRWLFDQCVLVETHEAMEFFQLDGSRPFAPNHGPGRNPYSIHERGTEEDASTTSRGEKGTFTP
jgi:hypothetical protein